MLDPFELDPYNYRLGNILGRVGNFTGLNGENGAMQFSTKSVGIHAGVYPSMQFGFNDAGIVPFKMYYFDVSQTAWYKPMTGGWRTGRTYTIGDYVLNGLKVYIAATAGTSGATIPTHTTGTVSDGGVDFTYVTTMVAANFKAQAIFGTRDDMPKFGLSATAVQFARETTTWNGVKHRYLNNAGIQGFEMGYDAGGDNFYLRDLIKTNTYLRFNTASHFFSTSGLARLHVPITLTSSTATPSVAGAEYFVYSNTVAKQ